MFLPGWGDECVPAVLCQSSEVSTPISSPQCSVCSCPVVSTHILPLGPGLLGIPLWVQLGCSVSTTREHSTNFVYSWRLCLVPHSGLSGNSDSSSGSVSLFIPSTSLMFILLCDEQIALVTCVCTYNTGLGGGFRSVTSSLAHCCTCPGQRTRSQVSCA